MRQPARAAAAFDAARPGTARSPHEGGYADVVSHTELERLARIRIQMTGETLERALAVLRGDTTDTAPEPLIGTGSTTGTESGAGAGNQARTTDGTDGSGAESGSGAGSGSEVEPRAGDGHGAPPKLRSVPALDPGVTSASGPAPQAEPTHRAPRPRRRHLRGL
ncbi:hypothetical protein GCM10009864_50580 [Streptomyces lunalinharesii]|uniref:Uncharacterized protein n=1 Tax=Streptomyces lunalinharesii TaxID=333384 RepID=A0ABP6EPS1_9ACTN